MGMGQAPSKEEQRRVAALQLALGSFGPEGVPISTSDPAAKIIRRAEAIEAFIAGPSA